MEQGSKIGIGPEGAAGGLVQFALCAVVGIALLVYSTPLTAIVMTLIPGSLFVLVALGHLSLLGDNYPMSPPGGGWNPSKSRFTAGAAMTAIWALFSGVIFLVTLNLLPVWPMGPVYLWFGVIAFWLTLLYGINWNGWPLKGKLPPWGTMAASFCAILAVSSVIWSTLTNLGGTPFAGSPMDHGGPLNVNWLTGYLVWSIAWFFILNPVFVTQGWPFGKLGHPGAALAQTVAAHILSLICWNGSLAMGVGPTFSFGAVASSIIFWSLVYSWHLQFLGITKLTGGTRAVAAIIAVFLLTAVWIGIMNVVLAPAAAGLASGKLPADINILIIYVNLCVIGPVLIAHNAFWLRWPLTLPAPPGTPAPDQSV